MKSRESGRSILEESLVKSDGSNGVVERGVQGVEGQVRVSFLALPAVGCQGKDCEIHSRICSISDEQVGGR